ncbi:oligosaccharide flippase family protein [Nocardia uniformis]|uniref:Oligosaccharide flippase family protein n=1 Tax=Nocardia uniformis TaxID=53432 RepID=A0A849C2Y0_9NOCA|nr:oligosaccharide flippase family protein [Nocardia uniformis]NNH70790.1 oligosaccharide flippase family protein [Nocardia uniformis]
MHRYDGNEPDRAAVPAYDIIRRHVSDAPTVEMYAVGPISSLGRGSAPPPGHEPVPESASESGGESTLTRRVGRVAAASAVALVFSELVSFGQTIALARLLSPAEVGMFAAGTVLTMLLTTFVEGGLRSALVQRKERVADAAETVFRASFVNATAVTVCALAAAPIIGMIFDNRTIGLIAAATSGFLLLFALTNVPEALLQRDFSVKRRIIVGPAVSVSFAVVSVVLAARGFGVWSMVIGSYVSYVVWVVTVWWLARWRPGRGRASFRLWRELARYGSPVVLGMLGARLQSTAEAAVVGRGLSASALGHYRYGQRIAQIPVRFIVEVGAFSLFPAFARIAEEGDRERLRAAYLRAIRITTVGAAALTGLIIALGEPAVVIVFGDRWRAAGAVVVAMAGLGLGKAWMSVSEEAIKGAGRTGLLNWQTALEVVLGIGLLLVGIKLFGLVGVGLATSATALIVAVVITGLARSVVGVRPVALLRAVAPPLPAAALALAATWPLEHLVLQADTRPILVGIGALLLDALVFVVIYLLVLAILAPDVVRGFARLAVRLGHRVRRNSTSRGAISVNSESRPARETN